MSSESESADELGNLPTMMVEEETEFTAEEQSEIGLTESGSEAETEPYGKPNKMELLLPAIGFMLLILLVIILLSIWKTYGIKKKQHVSSTEEIKRESLTGVRLYSDNDKQILTMLESFPFALKPMLFLILPAMLSLAFLPVALLLHDSLIEFLWPSHVFVNPPKVNDVISCFLIPAGLVYAIAFGFAFQEAAKHHTSYRMWFISYSSSMKQFMLIMTRLQNVPDAQKRAIIDLLKNSFIRNCQYILHKNYSMNDCLFSVQMKLYDIKQKMIQQKVNIDGTSIDEELCDRLLEMILILQQQAVEIYSFDSIMNVFQWIFLESLGYFSFFGILLVDADSYRLELLMCLVTVLTISMFSYVLSDLDDPFHGIFKVQLDPLFEIYKLLGVTYCTFIKEEERLVTRVPTSNVDQKTDLGLIENHKKIAVLEINEI